MACKLIFRAIALFSFAFAGNAQLLLASPAPATFRIAGIVVDSVTNQPLEGAEVAIAPVTALDDAQTFLTSSTGRFLFANVPAGKYRLLANRRGYALQAFNEHEAFSTAIVVGPGLDSENIRFPLAPSSVITGLITDEWGDPVRDAKVLLFQQSMFDGSRILRNVNQTMTDDQGRYRFAHLLSGMYAVAVYARPWYTQSQVRVTADVGQYEGGASRTFVMDGGSVLLVADNSLFDVVYPITFFPNAASLAEATRFALAPGATETANFQLRAVPSVHLRVRVPGQPVTITTHQEDGQQGESTEVAQIDSTPDIALKIGDTYTDQIEPTRKQIAPGIVELSGIPPGQIEVNMMTASILGMQDDNIVSHGKTLNISGDTEVDLSAQGDSAAISGVVVANTFTATAAAATANDKSSSQTPSSGSASGASGQESSDPQAPDAPLLDSQEPLSNVMFSLRSLKTGESYRVSVSVHGNFSFAASSFPAGVYEVEFPGQTGLRVSSLEATGATVSGRTVEIPAGQPVTLTVHAAEANCSISGVALKNGKPVAGAMVLLVPQDPGHDMSLYHRDQSDTDGSFTMSPLLPGRYVLLAIENGWDLEWADPKVMFQYLPAGQPLELQPNASLTLNAKVQ